MHFCSDEKPLPSLDLRSKIWQTTRKRLSIISRLTPNVSVCSGCNFTMWWYHSVLYKSVLMLLFRLYCFPQNRMLTNSIMCVGCAFHFQLSIAWFVSTHIDCEFTVHTAQCYFSWTSFQYRWALVNSQRPCLLCCFSLLVWTASFNSTIHRSVKYLTPQCTRQQRALML